MGETVDDDFMNRRHFATPALLSGLITAQMIAAIQVYLSNTELHRTLEIVRGQGYLPVPNAQAMPTLMNLAPAFWGGLFFTLTIGAGLSLASLAAARVWDLFFQRSRIFLGICIISWLGISIGMNLRGFNPLTSAYFLLIPPLVFRVALSGSSSSGPQKPGRHLLITVAPVFLLAVLWLPHLDRNFFGDFRDRLLLSNRFGQKINRFYYDYTLYAAEAVKSLDQKTIKTCRLEGMYQRDEAANLKKNLILYDYLPVDGPGVADLRITKAGEGLILSHTGKPRMRLTTKDFLSRTAPVLKEFSRKTDRLAAFRSVLFLSLLLGLPIVLYLFLLDLFRFGFGFFLGTGAAWTAAALICVFLGAGLLGLFRLYSGEVNDRPAATRALRSGNPSDRVAALKWIAQNGLEIHDFATYDRLRSSSHISERYWLVRSLGSSRQERAYGELLKFLDDPHLNVACMAFYALGKRGDRRAVPVILQKFRDARHWYLQWYAYQALKTLGWTQKGRK